MKNIIITAICMGVLQVYSQTETTQEKNIKISSFSFGVGAYNLKNSYTNTEEINLVTKNPFFKDDLSTYLPGFWYGYTAGNSGFNQVNFQLGLEHKKLKNQEFQIGFTYQSRFEALATYEKTVLLSVDTFSTANTTDLIYVDNKVVSGYFIEKYMDELGINLGYTFSTDKNRLLYLQSGLLLNISYGVNSSYQLHYNRDTNTIIHTQEITHEVEISNEWPYHQGGIGNSYHERDVIKDDNSYLFTRLYIPMGLHFRFSKKVPIVKNLFVNSQVMPGVEFSKNGINPLIGFNTGLSYRL